MNSNGLSGNVTTFKANFAAIRQKVPINIQLTLVGTVPLKGGDPFRLSHVRHRKHN